MKGPVSRLSIEESSPEKGREEAASKGHVIYEGKSGHILSYDNIKNAREGTRSPRTAHEISLKRSYESVEGTIKQGLSMRESPVSAPLEGKVFPELCLDTFNSVQPVCIVGLGCI